MDFRYTFDYDYQTRREREFVDLIQDYLFEDDGFINTDYIVCYVKGDKVTLKHELAHSRYFSDEEYKKQVDKVLTKIPKSLIKKYHDGLKRHLYNKSVYKDEINAYITAYDSKEHFDMFGIKESEIRDIKKELDKFYDN